MDRSRRRSTATPPTPAPPASSKLTLRGRKNRRKPASVWARMPAPSAIADACGRALRRSVPGVVAGGAVLGVGSALYLGYNFVTTSERYAITSIEIRGAAKASPDELRASMPVALGDNVFTTSPDDVAAAARRHPWVASASAQRILPDTIVVDIREHVAAAVAILGEAYLVDEAGHPFKRARLDSGEGAGLPVISGLERAAFQRDPAGTAASITAALGVLARWRAAAARPAIGEILLGVEGTIAFRTSDRGAAIELGPLTASDDVVAARLRTFDAAWAELTDAERARARAFHLDARHDQVTVAFAKD